LASSILVVAGGERPKMMKSQIFAILGILATLLYIVASEESEIDAFEDAQDDLFGFQPPWHENPSSYRAIGLDYMSGVTPTQDIGPSNVRTGYRGAWTSSKVPKLETPEFSFEESDHATVVRLVNENIAIGLLTTASYHSRIMDAMNSWWDYKRFKDVVSVFSDTTNTQSSEVGRPIANVIDTGCESSYNYGIWCKNAYMMEYWQTSEKFKNVKWFVRVMDDTYVHLENILQLVSQYDYREKMVIGEKWCKNGEFEFPIGGSGFIISRAVVEDFDWPSWAHAIKRVNKMSDFVDDMAWGNYLKLRKIPIVHHGGIRQFPQHPTIPIYRYWMQFHPSNFHNNRYVSHWNMDFRPLLLHQQNAPIPMKVLHQNLHELRYTPVATKNLIEIPYCFCNSDRVIRKCFIDQAMLDQGACFRPEENLFCTAPGPWHWFVPELMHAPPAFHHMLNPPTAPHPGPMPPHRHK
jgi:hypothetical protein